MTNLLLVLLCALFGFTVGDKNGTCVSTSDCFGLGDCIDGLCKCEAYASGSADCSVFRTTPVVSWDAAGYRNSSSPSWGGTFIVENGRMHGFVGSMTPGFENRTSSYGAPQVVHITATSVEAPWVVTGQPADGYFQAQMHRIPEVHGGGFVLFSNAQRGSSERGLSAGYVADLDNFGVGDAPRMFNVFEPPVVDKAHPWICHTNDWGATILPDGSVLALFRNGGCHCDKESYPGWPNEQLGLARADCWNCTYHIITDTPLFANQPGGVSNEDGFLFWTHRGLHMVLHSQDRSDPAIPHQVRGTVAFSPDITNFAPESWVVSTSACYNQSIKLANGTTLVAKRRQRPTLVFESSYPSAPADAATGWPRRVATMLSNAVDLDYGLNANGWGNAWALLQPLAREERSSKVVV